MNADKQPVVHVCFCGLCTPSIEAVPAPELTDEDEETAAPAPETAELAAA